MPDEYAALGNNKFDINAIFGDDIVELSIDGSIDDRAIHAFTHGHCHSFALALCALLPGAVPMIADNNGGHAAAKLPDGRLLDVEGELSRDTGRWTVPDFAPAEDYLGDFFTDADWEADGWREARPMDALPYAETLLRELDFQI